MKDPFPRIDIDGALYQSLLPFARLARGEVWEDPVSGHRIGVMDAANKKEIELLCGGLKATLFVHDPPYNFLVGEKKESALLGTRPLRAFVDWMREWVARSIEQSAQNASFYFWLGADQNNGFAPLPDAACMLREFSALSSRSFITMRNQRGYGTQRNWMSVRQELLYYTKGTPFFRPQYTDIPKSVKGYYKDVKGTRVETIARGKADTIRAGNVWIDIQQVFYRLEENVPGCYAQKPLKAIERIMNASSEEGDTVCDFFLHSGTTLIAGERLRRRVIACDIDPLFAEIAIRRLERYRETGKTGFQTLHPFPEALEGERHG